MVLQKIKKLHRRNATLKKQYQFNSLLQLIPRKKFDELVVKWEMDKGIKNFRCFELTCVLIVSSILELESFRSVEETLGVPKSTFGDALNKRPFGFFHDLCVEILRCLKAQTSDRKTKRALREILALDSSEIMVHGSAFCIPGWQQKSVGGQHKASGKIHVVWNINGEWVEDYRVTPGRKGDSPVSLEFKPLSGKMYVFDRAYNDISFWYKLTEHQSDFVSRLKDCSRIRYMELTLKVATSQKTGVLFDGIYKPSKATLVKHKTVPKGIKFRHVIYRDPISNKLFHFISSDFNISAKEIAAIYKKRWALELLFRWMKGHLNIRRLATENPNAIKIQLTISVLVLLLLQFQKMVEQLQGTLWEFLRSIRATMKRNGLISQGFHGYIRGFSASRAISTA